MVEKEKNTQFKKRDSLTLPWYVIDALDLLETVEAGRVLKAVLTDDPYAHFDDDEAYLYAIATLILGVLRENGEVRDG